FLLVKNKIPKKLQILLSENEVSIVAPDFHPLKIGSQPPELKKKRTNFMFKIILFVLLIRCLLFVASYFSIPIEFVAVLGSLVLLMFRWYHLGTNPIDLVKKTPWHILVFAFSMYVIIYGLHNVGL